MIHKEHTLNSSLDVTLYTQAWLPDQTPKAIVIVQHGFCEHSGRYRHVAEYLVNKGYAVYALDLRGHGQSQGKRIYIDVFERHVEDFTRFVYWVQHHNPNTPLFVLAHSMGGTIATLWAAQNPPDISGLILSGAAIQIIVKVPKVLLALSDFASKYLPHLPTLHFNNPDALSRDPQISDQRTKDPFIYRGRIPARSGAELLKGAQQAHQSLDKITLPLLILHGTQDTITSPQGSQGLHERAPSQDKTLILYEDFRHEILNETERARVLNDIHNWIQTHLTQKPVSHD